MSKDLGRDIPYVRICIPIFNSARTLEHTLKSIVGQTYGSIRIAIVNNASTDRTRDIAYSYRERFSNIDVFDFQEHVSAEENFTRCLQLADGNFTALYHSDDIYSVCIVEKQVAFLVEHPEVGAVFTGADYINEYNQKIGEFKFPAEIALKALPVFDLGEMLKIILRHGNILPCPSAMVRSHIYRDEIRSWNGERYATSADLDVWFRILNRHKIGIINEPLLKYRVSKDSFSFRSARSRTERHNLFRVLDDYVQLNKHLLDHHDAENYFLLQMEDAILVRSINMLFQCKGLAARQLLRPIFCTKGLSHLLKSFRGFRLLILALLTIILSLLPLGYAGRKFLFLLRFRSG